MGHNYDAAMAARGIMPQMQVEQNEDKTSATATVKLGGRTITVVIHFEDGKFDPNTALSQLHQTIAKISPLMKEMSGNLEISLNSEGKILNDANVRPKILDHLKSKQRELTDELMTFDLDPQKRAQLTQQHDQISKQIKDIKNGSDLSKEIFRQTPMLRSGAQALIKNGRMQEGMEAYTSMPPPKPLSGAKQPVQAEKRDAKDSVEMNEKMKPPLERVTTQMREAKDLESRLGTNLNLALNKINLMLSKDNLTNEDRQELQKIKKDYENLITVSKNRVQNFGDPPSISSVAKQYEQAPLSLLFENMNTVLNHESTLVDLSKNYLNESNKTLFAEPGIRMGKLTQFLENVVKIYSKVPEEKKELGIENTFNQALQMINLNSQNLDSLRIKNEALNNKKFIQKFSSSAKEFKPATASQNLMALAFNEKISFVEKREGKKIINSKNINNPSNKKDAVETIFSKIMDDSDKIETVDKFIQQQAKIRALHQKNPNDKELKTIAKNILGPNASEVEIENFLREATHVSVKQRPVIMKLRDELTTLAALGNKKAQKTLTNLEREFPEVFDVNEEINDLLIEIDRHTDKETRVQGTLIYKLKRIREKIKSGEIVNYNQLTSQGENISFTSNGSLKIVNPNNNNNLYVHPNGDVTLELVGNDHANARHQNRFKDADSIAVHKNEVLTGINRRIATTKSTGIIIDSAEPKTLDELYKALDKIVDKIDKKGQMALIAELYNERADLPRPAAHAQMLSILGELYSCGINKQQFDQLIAENPDQAMHEILTQHILHSTDETTITQVHMQFDMGGAKGDLVIQKLAIPSPQIVVQNNRPTINLFTDHVQTDVVVDPTHRKPSNQEAKIEVALDLFSGATTQSCTMHAKV